MKCTSKSAVFLYLVEGPCRQRCWHVPARANRYTGGMRADNLKLTKNFISIVNIRWNTLKIMAIFLYLVRREKNHTVFQSIWNVLPKKCAIKYWRWISLSHNWMIVRMGYAPREVCRDLPKSSERTKGAIRRSSDGSGTASGKNDSSHQTNS